MFKISVSPSYSYPVTVDLPGARVKPTFDAVFKRLPQSELDVLIEKVKSNEMDDAGFVREVLVGWKGVSDETGELVFSEENLSSLLNVYPVARCVVEAFYASLTGVNAKN
jgi:hypothetical protein